MVAVVVVVVVVVVMKMKDRDLFVKRVFHVSFTVSKSKLLLRGGVLKTLYVERKYFSYAHRGILVKGTALRFLVVPSVLIQT